MSTFDSLPDPYMNNSAPREPIDLSVMSCLHENFSENVSGKICVNVSDSVAEDMSVNLSENVSKDMFDVSDNERITDDSRTVGPFSDVGYEKSFSSLNEQDNKKQNPHIFHNLFLLCESCQKDGGKDKNSIKRRLSSKKREGLSKDDITDITVQQSSFVHDEDFTSHRSLSLVEGFQDEGDKALYVEIDDDWLTRVRQLMGDSLLDEEFPDETDGVSCYPDDEIYMRMNIFTLADQDNSVGLTSDALEAAADQPGSPAATEETNAGHLNTPL